MSVLNNKRKKSKSPTNFLTNTINLRSSVVCNQTVVKGFEVLPTYEESILKKALQNNKRVKKDKATPLCIDLDAESPRSPIVIFETKFDQPCPEKSQVMLFDELELSQKQTIPSFTRHKMSGLPEPSYLLVWFFISVEKNQEHELSVVLSVYEEKIINTIISPSNPGYFKSTHHTSIETVKQKDVYLYLNSVTPLNYEQQNLLTDTPTKVLKNCYEAFLITVDQHFSGCIFLGKNLFMVKSENLDIDNLFSAFKCTLNKDYSFFTFNNTTPPGQNNISTMSEEEINKIEEWLMSDEFELPFSICDNPDQQQATLIIFDSEN